MFGLGEMLNSRGGRLDLAMVYVCGGELRTCCGVVVGMLCVEWSVRGLYCRLGVLGVGGGAVLVDVGSVCTGLIVGCTRVRWIRCIDEVCGGGERRWGW